MLSLFLLRRLRWFWILVISLPIASEHRKGAKEHHHPDLAIQGWYATTYQECGQPYFNADFKKVFLIEYSFKHKSHVETLLYAWKDVEGAKDNFGKFSTIICTPKGTRANQWNVAFLVIEE